MNPWLLGGLGVVGALTLAPYVLPVLGIGNADLANHMMGFMGSSENPFGSGIAGELNKFIGGIPLVGGALTSTASVSLPFIGSVASGALVTMGATAVIGIGGMLLANWMEKREDPNQGGIRWSKVIRYASLATSMFIALPSLLGAISIGVSFLASLFGPAVGNPTLVAMKEGLGATAMSHGVDSAASGLAALLPHFFSCGAAALPVVGALFANGRSAPEIKPAPQVREGQPQGPVSAHQGMAHAH